MGVGFISTSFVKLSTATIRYRFPFLSLFFKYYKVIRDLNKGSGTNKGVFGFDSVLKTPNFLANWAVQQEVLEVLSDSSSGPFFFGPFGAKFDHKLSVAMI